MSEVELTQETLDVGALCDALAVTMRKHNWSLVRLSEASGIPLQNLRRMARSQEPRYSQLVHLERVMGLPLGTVVREARLCDVPFNLEEALETEPRLTPLYRRLGVESLKLWIGLSVETAN